LAIGGSQLDGSWEKGSGTQAGLIISETRFGPTGLHGRKYKSHAHWPCERRAADLAETEAETEGVWH